MADQIRGAGEAAKDQAKLGQEEAVSLARRRAMKAGLASVPVILTLRSKPLFADRRRPRGSAALSANNSAGIQGDDE